MKNTYYYDGEYDKEVTEDYIKHQFNWFMNNGYTGSYETFKADNFTEVHSKRALNDLIGSGMFCN